MKLTGKTAVITGAAWGIGAAIARRFAQEGAECVLADKDFETATETAHGISAEGGSAYAQLLDVTKQKSIEALVADVVERSSKIDILVNNAGIFDMAPLAEITREAWDRVFDVNVKGLFFTLQTVATLMVQRGEGGKIINLASQAGRHGIALVLHYCATKAAVISITQSAALELIKLKINVNAISPGVVDTDVWVLTDRLFAKYQGLAPGEKKRMAGEAVPFGRMGKPEDLVGAATFLASTDADYVVGQTFNIDGGNRLN